MTPDELLTALRHEFDHRKFVAGLLVSMIDLFLELDVPDLGATDFAGVVKHHPRQTTFSGGRRANTLILARNGSSESLSLRPFYNQIERHFTSELKRFDYPNCAPHATQAWTDYEHWLDALATFSRPELSALRQSVIEFVLEALPSHELDPDSIRHEPPLFKLMLETFDLAKHKGEKTGAAYQGLVFGFLRADNPHLQVEIDRVRTGSSRRQRVGDIDAWEGARLAITAEVKQFELPKEKAKELHKFANQATQRGAIGLVVALSFGEGAREAVEGLGVHALDLEDLLRIVELWDPTKQRIAVSSMVYYVQHVERNKALTDRLALFLKDPQEGASRKIDIGQGAKPSPEE